ncbi:lipopolysaccharide kinase InaA family protein [Christiangramia portivictoriae]|uniref:lipopolysaccharide kinase InaA family protein n=1 Tax=Christiangramia portivictoriae TaxID=326069 RepID=UPI00040710E0|nr:lipopolysaccharide kinase InaA family protein [Christiangramia portivictoriae]
MKAVFSNNYLEQSGFVKQCIENFDSKGKILAEGRNEIRIFENDAEQYNIKSFRIPNTVNKIAYRFFRKSKAQRSFEYASILEKKGIGTPAPVAYFENPSSVFFRESFYVCRHLQAHLTFRELVTDLDFPDHENILRAFTRFTYELHQKNIQFLDHSPGNTLIVKTGSTYEFFLVDLNRMNFKELNFEERMQNFSRLTPKRIMVKIMANEYAGFINKSEEEVFEKMWFYTEQFQHKFQRKKALKKKIKFWKR